MGDAGLDAEKNHDDDHDDNHAHNDNHDDDDDNGGDDELLVAVLTRADNHRPCREHWQAKTLKISLLSRALSFCSENDTINNIIIIITIVNIHHQQSLFSFK